MLKHIPTVAGALLGLAFLFASLAFFLNLFPEQEPPPPGSPADHFMTAIAPTGYLSFIKVFELLGAVLVAIPLTRRAGLVILCPIIINIVAFHVFVMDGVGLTQPMLVGIVVLAVYLLFVERAALFGLIGKRPQARAKKADA